MEPLHLLIELVRAEDAATQHGARPGDEQLYLMRDPDDTGRYAEGSFRWTRAVQADLAALADLRDFEEAALRLAALVGRFLEDTPWARYAPLVDAAIDEGRGAVITIRSAAAELYALPWEWLPLAQGPATRVPGCVVRYDWPDDELRADRLVAPGEDDPLARTEPQTAGRIVVAWSARAGAVPAAEHLRAISSAASEGRLDFEWDTDVIDHVTRARLKAALDASDDVAVLHLLCHGVPLPGDDGFGLGLADDEGGLDVVAPRELAELLRPHAATLRLVVVQACQSGNTGGLESHAGSVAQAIHRAGIPVVLASRYPLSVAGSVRITERFYRSLLVDLRSTEAATLAARQDEVAIPGSFDWAALQLYADPEVGLESRPIAFRPFRGLLPFESRHARFFFGRDDDVAALVDRLGARLREGGPRLLLVAGASGSGKSSLVHAGLLPALANSALPELPHDPATDLVLFRPGERPDDPLSLLRERLARAAEAGSDRAVVVVIDQLEELFTEVDEPARTSLTRALWGLATEGHDVVVATVRIEFIGRFGEVPMDDEGRKFDAVALDERFRYFVRQLAPEQVDAIIHGPARAVGLRFEDGLVARLRADVGREPGALPLLSYTLDLLWQHRRGRWLKDQTYDALGRLVGALTTTADDLYASLGAPARQAQAERLLVQLVHMAEDPAMATRRRGHLDRLRPAAAAEGAHFDAAVDALVDARLLVRGCSSDERRGLDRAWIEIAHEALIRGWTRLQTWLRESREWLDYTDDLRAYAEAWSPHQGGTRETDYLLTGTRLAYAAEMWSRHGARLGAGDQRLLGAFVERCTERERARLRGRRAIIGAVFTAISIAAVIAIVQAIAAGRARDDAEDKARVAREQTAVAEAQTEIAETKTAEALAEARRARNATRLSAARSLLTRDPTAAALILAEVEAAEPVPGLEAIIRSLTADTQVAERVLDSGDDIYYPESSGDGRVIAVLYGDGVVRLRDANTGAPMAGPLALRGPDATGRLTPTPRYLQIVALSPDGAVIATGTWDGDVRLWSAADGSPLGPPLKHESAIKGILFSHDGRTLLTSSWSRKARLWDARSGASLGEPMPGEEAFFSADGAAVITTFADGVLRWSAHDGAPLPLERGRSQTREDDDLVVVQSSFGGSGVARRWNATTGRSLGPPLDHEGVKRASLEREQGVIITVSNSEVRLWRAQTGEAIGPPITYDEVRDEVIYGLRTAALSRDGELVLTLDGFDNIRLWEARSGAPFGLPMRHENVELAEFSSDGASIITAAVDGSIRRWPVGLRRGRVMTHDALLAPREEREFRRIVEDARLAGDGSRLVTASWDGSAQLWSASTGEPIGEPMLHESSVSSAALSPDGSRVLTASGDRSARLWDARSGAPIGEPMLHESSVSSAEFSADGAMLATASEDGCARIWSGTTGAAIGEPLLHPGQVRSASFSPDGRSLVTVATDMNARVWSLDAGALRFPPITHEDKRVTVARFSPDGKVIATGSVESTARLWDAATGAAIGDPMTHEDQVLDVRFSPRGDLLATGSIDGTARLWDARSGAPLGEPITTDGLGHNVAFSPDARTLLTSGIGDTAQLWDVRTREQIGRTLTHDAGIESARFSPDGRLVLTASSDGSARLWDAATGESLMEAMWLRYLRANVRGCLPRDARVEHLGVTSEQAAADFAACEARQTDAGAPP